MAAAMTAAAAGAAVKKVTTPARSGGVASGAALTIVGVWLIAQAIGGDLAGRIRQAGGVTVQRQQVPLDQAIIWNQSRRGAAAVGDLAGGAAAGMVGGTSLADLVAGHTPVPPSAPPGIS